MKTRHFPGSGLLFDFGTRDIEAYSAEKPALDLRNYLRGPLTASGVFLGLSGRVERRFTIDMAGNWSGNHGTLDERFRYDDGETGERLWNLVFADNGSFTATAHDLKGMAAGMQRGNAAVMRYRMRVPRGKGEVVVGMEDWFYLVDDGTLVNQARMSKFGLKVGELVAAIRKRSADDAPAAPESPP